ncbi:hypothetical protein HNR19_000781 [Nocardioides thalensis]|uniref:Uncharacterized protein n=1 Tax=Nocardioides thalensis TaxID=1914755 RepID=A0A853C150_9ACTN|nr:hypothetical protein [Nocardioides thalensis]NYJ00083.1 hypothetical protein [Nocardioides thalensis]
METDETRLQMAVPEHWQTITPERHAELMRDYTNLSTEQAEREAAATDHVAHALGGNLVVRPEPQLDRVPTTSTLRNDFMITTRGTRQLRHSAYVDTAVGPGLVGEFAFKGGYAAMLFVAPEAGVTSIHLDTGSRLLTREYLDVLLETLAEVD